MSAFVPDEGDTLIQSQFDVAVQSQLADMAISSEPINGLAAMAVGLIVIHGSVDSQK